MLQTLDFAQQIQGADVIISGEGKIDAQSLHGKALLGVAKRARAQQIPVIAIAAILDTGYEAIFEHGISAAFSIMQRPEALAKLFQHSGSHVTATAENIARLLRQCLVPKTSKS